MLSGNNTCCLPGFKKTSQLTCKVDHLMVLIGLMVVIQGIRASKVKSLVKIGNGCKNIHLRCFIINVDNIMEI